LKADLTVPLDFFLDLITHGLEHCHNQCGYKMQAIPSIGKGKHNKFGWHSKYLSQQNH
jgi:hypothetical protein